jgi:coenzyme F420-reducing hydrogenase alpha subunit
MTNTALHIDHIARVEGHGNVRVVVADGAVDTVEIQVVEPARFFESMVRGRDYSEVTYISSRICGICSASHVVTDLKAIERAFDVQPSARTQAIRELLVYGSYLQNHATHLFVLATPDFVGTPDIFPLAASDPALLNSALEVKALGNELCTRIGGRSVHPITAVVGGFTHEVAPEEYLELAGKMEGMLPFMEKAVDLFNSFPITDISTDGDMLAMVQDGYYPIITADTARFLQADLTFEAGDIGDNIEEYAVDRSAALFARARATGRPYMATALSRINASWKHLSSNAKVAAAKAGLRPPELNPLKNNVAQAVELVDALERCAGICRRLAADGYAGTSEPVPFSVKAGRGVGFTEAPRGALFHDLTIDEAGKVVHASILTPTAQNLASIEADVRKLAEKLVSEGIAEAALKLEVEKLIRAYDPCFSCSVH